MTQDEVNQIIKDCSKIPIAQMEYTDQIALCNIMIAYAQAMKPYVDKYVRSNSRFVTVRIDNVEG